MPELENIFNRYLTDKGANGYAGVYECIFNNIRYSVNNLLEIGIGTVIPGMWSTMAGYAPDGYRPGASLRAWRDYFPNAMIYGVDLQPDTQFQEHRICTMLADSRSSTHIQQAMSTHGISQLDIIIDDGSHSITDQLATLGVMMQYVKPGGTYIIEDIGAISQQDMFDQVKSIVGDLPMFMAGPVDNMCIISNPIKGSYQLNTYK